MWGSTSHKELTKIKEFKRSMLYSRAMNGNSEKSEIHSLYDLKKKAAEKHRNKYGEKKKHKGSTEWTYDSVNTPNNYYYEQYKHRVEGDKNSKTGSTMLIDDHYNRVSPCYEKNMTQIADKKEIEFGNYGSNKSQSKKYGSKKYNIVDNK